MVTALQGTFELMSFGEVVGLLASKQETGRLHVRSKAVGADLYMSEGAFSGITLGDEPAPASANAARQRLDEVCFELLSAERGTFEFHPGASGRPAATLSVKVETVLAAARRRADEWQEIRAVIPALDVHPLMAEELGPEAVTLDRQQWEVLAALDGRRTVHALARKLHLSEFDTCRILKSLIDDGAVVLPDAEAQRVARANQARAESKEGAEPRPPLRISSKRPRPDDNGAAEAKSNPEPTPKSKDGSRSAEADGKRSRLPTVSRLRRSRPDEQA